MQLSPTKSMQLSPDATKLDRGWAGELGVLGRLGARGRGRNRAQMYPSGPTCYKMSKFATRPRSW